MFFVPFMVAAAAKATAVTAIAKAFAAGITVGAGIATLTDKNSKKTKIIIRR